MNRGKSCAKNRGKSCAKDPIDHREAIALRNLASAHKITYPVTLLFGYRGCGPPLALPLYSGFECAPWLSYLRFR
jgi:hypothetical protein